MSDSVGKNDLAGSLNFGALMTALSYSDFGRSRSVVLSQRGLRQRQAITGQRDLTTLCWGGDGTAMAVSRAAIPSGRSPI